MYNSRMITEQDLEKYSTNISVERLKSFIRNEDDTIEKVLSRYVDNIQISQSLYPELSILEITLRNSIDSMLKANFSEHWLEEEIEFNKILVEKDYNTLLNTYNSTKEECKNNSKEFTQGKVIANLNFGFWTSICSKQYSLTIWHKKKCFRSVFANYPSKKQEISKISRQLYEIRRLRNRIFHYEQIFKHPTKTLNVYDNIKEFLSYMPDNGNSTILSKTSSFVNTYNRLICEYTK